MARQKVIPPNYGDVKRIIFPEKQKYRMPTAGSFSRIRCVSGNGEYVAANWMYCREYFQDCSQGIRRMFFVTKRNRGRNIASFIDRVEAKLSLRQRTQFGPTQRNNIIWIKIAPWWTTSSMRRSLFTALLRAGNAYNLTQDNFSDALYSIKYTAETKYAVERFLSGYTTYTGTVRGWFNQFRYGSGSPLFPRKPSPKKVRELLVKPD